MSERDSAKDEVLVSVSVRDLSDFCLQWEELRSLLSEEKLLSSTLSLDQKTVIFWLKTLADRTCKDGS